MSRNTFPVIPPAAQNAAVTPHPTELTLTLIRQFARNNHTVKQLSITDNMISLSWVLKKNVTFDAETCNKYMGTMVAPSLLAADFLNLERDVEMLNRSEADWIHLDIMDGVFVPNISFGFPVINLLQKVTKKPLDVHLMIVQPEKFIDEIAATGATYMNVHYEACTHLHRVVQEIRKKGMKPAVTLNPHTPLSVLEDILPDLDMVLLMSVNPGFGGQQFIEHTVRKVDQLKKMTHRLHAETLIEVDGGVNLETGRRLVDAGADVLVAGSFIFSSDNPEETIRMLRAL